MVAEGNDALLEEFFDKGTLPIEHIVDGLRAGVPRDADFPCVLRLRLHNIGTDLLLNFIVEYLPAPADREAVAAMVNGAERHAEDLRHRPASAFVFKTTADPFAGRITYFKVMYRRREKRRQPA